MCRQCNKMTFILKEKCLVEVNNSVKKLTQNSEWLLTNPHFYLGEVFKIVDKIIGINIYANLLKAVFCRGESLIEKTAF